MATTGTATVQQRLQQVRDATAKYLPATTDLLLGGQSVKVSDFLTGLDSALASLALVNEAKTGLVQARGDRKQKIAGAREQVAQLKTYLLATWGKGNPQLASFGFAPKPRTPLSSEQQALKTANATLTRKARGTKGSKQKLEVTTQGKPGLVLVDADGTPMPGVLKGPTAPGLPAEPTVAPAASGTPSGK